MNPQERRELEQLQVLTDRQRAASLKAFVNRIDGNGVVEQERQRRGRPRDLLDAMQRTDGVVEPTDAEHAAAREALIERLEVPELPPTLDRERRHAELPTAAGRNDDHDDDESDEGLSISSDGSEHVVPAPPPWSIPGRNADATVGGRDALSAIGDRLVGERWANRLKGDAARRYHVRRPGSRFGEPLLPTRLSPPPPPPQPVPPADPTPDELVMEQFRLEFFFSDADPEAPINASEFVAQAKWTKGLEAAWRGLYKKYAIEACEPRILAAPSVAVMKRRLLARLLVAGSIFDRKFHPTQFDGPVAACRSAVDIATLWRRTMLLYDAAPAATPVDDLRFSDLVAGARPRAADGTEERMEIVQPEPNQEPLRAMSMELTVLLGGLDLTIVFESPADKAECLRMAIAADIAEALRPRKRERGRQFFEVSVSMLEHGTLVQATVAIAKDKAVVRTMNQRMVDAVERGTFALKMTRDVLLNHYGVPGHAVVVNGAGLLGGAQVPADFIQAVPEVASHAPLRYDFATHQAIFTGAPPPKTDGDEEETMPPTAAPVPRFLDNVWRENPDWDDEARTVPPFGTERPRDMKLPHFSADGSVLPSKASTGVGAAAPRTADGSLAPPAVFQMLRRRNPLLDGA